MRRLLVFMLVAGMGVSAGAQSPVQVAVQRLAKKKFVQGDVRTVGNTTWYSSNQADASLTLRITVRNISISPIDGAVVRWGVAKTRLAGNSRAGDMAYGREEKCSLKPLGTQIIETETVEAARRESQLSQQAFGEKIRGHGVQVLIGGRVVWEEFVPATVRKSFENLRPVGEQEPAENPVRTGKTSKKQ
ncbi:MAG: hypothetical protein HZC54_14875 [Verrucomicrobia bacterium]|nr:hypothetical protein [Verrucomicrobiota bacterium]